MIYACLNGDIGLARRCVGNITNFNEHIFNGTYLSIAVDNGHLDIVKLLLKKGANVNHKDNANMTCLHYAYRSGHYDVAEYLLEYGAKINNKDCFTTYSGVSNCTRMVELFLENGANVQYMIKIDNNMNDDVKNYIDKNVKKRLYILSLIIQKDVFKYIIMRDILLKL